MEPTMQAMAPVMEARPTPGTQTTVWVWNGYSLAERDRRWDAVRARGQAAGFDCIFVPVGDGLDARYLTQLRNSVVVLPTDGRPPVVVADRGASNAWVPEPRHTVRVWGPPMADALKEAGMERARIGVVGLHGGRLSHVRLPDGAVNHTAFAHVLEALPNATFEDATDVVGFVRAVKSAEEITCLRQAARIAEAGVAKLVELARPGADASVVYAAVTERMLALGSEYYPLAITFDPIGERQSARYTNPPLGRRFQANDLITNEVSAIWGTQMAQEDQPILLGPIPAAWQQAIALQREVFEAGLAAMQPGTTFGEFADRLRRYERDGLHTIVLMHGRGAGDDGPLFTPRASGENVRDLPIQAGNAFVWKPTVASADGRIELTWGGDVIVTERGGEPLFTRPHGLVSNA
jgi:Xaa-Pro aminopeptidase